MPRFFFHLQNDASFTLDDEGRILPGREAACIEARRTIGDVIAQDVREGRNDVHLSLMIDDEAGTRIAKIQAVANLVFATNPLVG